MGWWDGMDMGPWTRGPEVETVGLPFAQAVAAERARVRGRRQRVAVHPRLRHPSLGPHWVISEAPEPAAEPCICAMSESSMWACVLHGDMAQVAEPCS